MMNQAAKRAFSLAFFFFTVLSVANARSFNDIFPGLSQSQRDEVFSGGIVRSLRQGQSMELLPSVSSGIDLAARIAGNNFPYLIESLMLVQHAEKALTLLDAYNAIGKVRNLKGLLYNSHTRGAEVPLFEDATRLDNQRRNNPIPDPPSAFSVPAQETIYVRLKDVNFGNTFYQADIASAGSGLTLNLSNYRNITYLLFPVMREGKFTALLYMEPLDEGMLVYSIAGADVSNFAAGMINVPSAISKRIAVFLDWISGGLNAGM